MSSAAREAISSDAIKAAAERIGPHIISTPLIKSSPMSQRSGADIFIKAEHLQHTGSFKVRGALNAVLSLDHRTATGGVITASSGNHGIAVATASSIRGISCTVYLPTGASASKVAAITHLGATIVTVDSSDAGDAESAARVEADRRGMAYISPYNDEVVVVGQGTIGLELTAQAADAGVDLIDAVVIAVGGGGLLSGIATWFAEHSPSTKIVGASPQNDMAMATAVAAGRIVDAPGQPTLSDGTAGAVEPGAVTFPICQRMVAEWITPTEREIAVAVAAMIDDHHQLVEGAAGVALAGAAHYGAHNPGSRVVAMSCGANISSATLRSALHLADS